MKPHRRIGIEVELVGPVGASRADLAEAIAAKVGGDVRENWHLDSEPSAHDSIKVFHHMTPAFDVVDRAGELVVRIVDDITIRKDLDTQAVSQAGWSRVVSDDPRFLRMLEPFLAPLDQDPSEIEGLVARMGLVVEHKEAATRLVDSSGASVALVAAMPGERERVAELISPVIEGDTEPWIELVMGPAAELGFSVPIEGATHLHYDAGPFRASGPFSRLVTAFGQHAEGMRELFNTNPNCTRIGRLPEALDELVARPDFEAMAWPEVVELLREVDGISKYLDVNIVHLMLEKPPLDTVEIRTLPSTASGAELTDMVTTVDAIIAGIIEPQGGS